ncbi:MAG: PQQ-dependent sugar dehydrogenase [Bacteroidia bacterium]|nr:PQQ-dependent sugar dehydrogenase [Bacteroidia bacterium]
MNQRLKPLLIIFFCTFFLACEQKPQKLLLFSQASESKTVEVDAARTAIKNLADAQEMLLDFREEADVFTEDSLKSYSALVFLHTSGEVLNDVQRAEVERFAQAGGGVLGMNAAPKVENEWRWYADHMQKESSQLSPEMEALGKKLTAAIGEKPLNYQLASTQQVPEESRFHKEILDFNLTEPMELDELPGRGILFVERRGDMKLYDFKEGQTRKIASLPIFYGNEDGLLGLAVDPNYEKNNWVYLFYSAPGDEPIQHISRFDLIDDSLYASSEKLLISVPTIRKCCHSGGALEFGPDGTLYIGLGDNTNPFESSGYAPIDERAGRALWDAQKSAANTNDLRGKILRIKPEDDGSYSIPEGNLFAPGTPNTRPEIFVMGCRNPFRPSIDSKTGYLYWGDVGPDAGETDPDRGPKGMGEFNQARAAGFWGWPYTRGNNQRYNDYQFASSTAGEKFNPQKLINDSPNNTGIQELPPAQESMIWFSYDSSDEFPWLGKGGVNPMAGPVFHAADYAEGFPDYFEDKLFVYEWMRDWVYVVTMDENHQYVKAEAFMPETEFSHPMDMIFGSDGNLYVLEYGQKWNSQNLDARLSQISYIKGNRTPIAKIEADKEVGALPLSVQFSAESSIDFDRDKLAYQWSFDSDEVQSTEENPSFTFQKEGIYTVKLRVEDPDGGHANTTHKILVGNEAPELRIEMEVEDNIYWDGRKIDYKVVVKDREDGSTEDGSIDPDKVKVSFTYLPEGEDIVMATIGHQQTTQPEGKLLIENSDCKACHAEKLKVNGPSYEDIASKYTREDKNTLIGRVIKGSSGIWGETMMAAHPQLEVEEVGKIIDYIFSLRPEEKDADNKMPLSGSLSFKEYKGNKAGGKYILMASYLDEGNEKVAQSTLASSQQIIFTLPKLEAEDADEKSEDLGVWNSQGARLVGSIAHNTFLKFEGVSFKNLESIQLAAAYNADYNYAGSVEVRQGSIDGKLLGQAKLGYSHPKKAAKKYYDISLEPTTIKGPLYLVFKNPADPDQYVLNANWILLNYNR